MSNGQVVALPTIATVPLTAEGERTPGFDKAQRFLERFGYLRAGQYTMEEIDQPTSAALAEFHLFSSLDATGRFDEATRHAMTQPRCAMPDVPSGVEFATTCAWSRINLSYALDTGTSDVADGFNALYPTRVVPDVREMTLTLAVTEIRAVGLGAQSFGSTGPDAWVYRQFPAAGRSVNVGSTVRLQTRTGPIP